MQAISDIRQSLNDPGVVRLVRECWARVPLRLLCVVALLTAATSYITLRSVTLQQEVIDALLPSNMEERAGAGATVWGLLLTMLALRLCDEILDVALTVVSDKLRSELEQRARIAFFQAVLSQPVADVDRVSGAELQRHLADAPYAIFDVTLIPVRLLRYCITFFGGLWAMLHLDWRLLLAAWCVEYRRDIVGVVTHGTCRRSLKALPFSAYSRSFYLSVSAGCCGCPSR